MIFLKNGAVIDPPPAETVIVQAIGPRAEDYQIRNLATGPGEKSATWWRPARSRTRPMRA